MGLAFVPVITGSGAGTQPNPGVGVASIGDISAGGAGELRIVGSGSANAPYPRARNWTIPPSHLPRKTVQLKAIPRKTVRLRPTPARKTVKIKV